MASGANVADNGVGGGGDFFNAERQMLEDELLQAESTLVGEMQQIENLDRENSKKCEELRRLEEDMKMVQERNEYEITMTNDEHTSVQQELNHKLAVLREQLAQLKLRRERYDEVTTMGEKDATDLKVLLEGMESRTKAHAEEVHATQQEVLYLRQGLETTFRKTLKDLEGTYREKAFNALEDEQKAGMQANKILRDEMALQDVGIASLSARHVAQSRTASTMEEEMEELDRRAGQHQQKLMELQREIRSMTVGIAGMQETTEKLATEEEALKHKLRRGGVPTFSLLTIRDMVKRRRAEAKRLDDVKLLWQQRVDDLKRAISRASCMPTRRRGTRNVPDGRHLPGEATADDNARRRSDGGVLSRIALTGSSSSPPPPDDGMPRISSLSRVGRHGGIIGGHLKDEEGDRRERVLLLRSEPSWQARVRQVVAGWGDDALLCGRPGKTHLRVYSKEYDANGTIAAESRLLATGRNAKYDEGPTMTTTTTTTTGQPLFP